jgi:uncharacterized protein GlcG (DUF336 family)
MIVSSFERASITAAAALKVLSACIEKAKELGHPFVVAIVDESGVMKANLRMDGAALLCVQIAQDKAYTAVGYGMSTDLWFDFIKDDGPLRLGAPSAINRLVPIGGGYPLLADGKVIGAVGVSGGHYTQDMTVAKAGVAALEDIEAGQQARRDS